MLIYEGSEDFTEILIEVKVNRSENKAADVVNGARMNGKQIDQLKETSKCVGQWNIEFLIRPFISKYVRCIFPELIIKWCRWSYSYLFLLACLLPYIFHLNLLQIIVYNSFRCQAKIKRNECKTVPAEGFRSILLSHTNTSNNKFPWICDDDT